MLLLLIVMVSVLVPVPLELLAVNVTLETPAPAGVPEIKPEEVLTVRPAGNPVALKLVGLLVAVIWYVKAALPVPVALEALVMTGAPASLTVRVKVAVPVPLALVALRVTVDVPAVVGVPEIRPEELLTLSPAGKPVALKLVGPLVAVI